VTDHPPADGGGEGRVKPMEALPRCPECGNEGDHYNPEVDAYYCPPPNAPPVDGGEGSEARTVTSSA
jgi:hypothetical protein